LHSKKGIRGIKKLAKHAQQPIRKIGLQLCERVLVFFDVDDFIAMGISI